MKRYLKMTGNVCALFGFDFITTFNMLRGLPFYFADLIKFLLQKKQDTSLPFGKFIPCVGDRFTENGNCRGHYFHQDLLVAREIFKENPKRHIDVGSRIDGFVTHVASFRKVEVIDIRSMPNFIPNIIFRQHDIMKEIDSSFIDCCDSLSCLHTLEHFGLGRYGDPICFDGHLIGLNNLTKMVQKGGKFYLSVPIGPQRVEFNAHRIFSVSYLLNLVSNQFKIAAFSYVNDQGELMENVTLNEEEINRSFGCYHGCGIFTLIKQ